MRKQDVIAALRTKHAWVSEERMQDLMNEARSVLGPLALPLECGRFVLGRLDAVGDTNHSGRLKP